jgi:hypothetical protein
MIIDQCMYCKCLCTCWAERKTEKGSGQWKVKWVLIDVNVGVIGYLLSPWLVAICFQNKSFSDLAYFLFRKLHFLLAQTQDLLMLIDKKSETLPTDSLQRFSRWPYNSLGFWFFWPEKDLFWKQDGSLLQGQKRAQRCNTRALAQSI